MRGWLNPMTGVHRLGETGKRVPERAETHRAGH